MTINSTALAGYEKPEPMIEKMISADSFSIPAFNYQRTALLKRFPEEMPGIDYISRPVIKLGGERFNPDNYTFVANYYFKKISYFDMQTKKEKIIDFGKNPILRETLWSPSGKHVAISIEKDTCQEVWIVEIPSLRKKKVSGVCLNSVLGRTVEWLDGDRLFLGVRTKNQSKAISQKKETPSAPVILESKGIVSQNRTYPDLVKSDQDEKIFAQALETDLVIYSVKTAKIKKILKTGMYSRTRFSPDRKLILIESFVLPFSRVVPQGLYAKKMDIVSLDGKVVYSFDQKGPFENLPIQGVPMGPRSIQWIESEPRALCYAEALDQGDWAVKADFRDEIFRIDFAGVEKSSKKPKPESILKLKNRYAGFQPLAQSESYFISDYERDEQWITTFWLTRKSKKDWDQKTIFSVSENDDYADPGNPVTIRNKMGRPVVATFEAKAGEISIFLSGKGASADGERPFLQSFNLANLKKDEIFRAAKGTYENFLMFQDDSFQKFYTSFESAKQSPEFRLHDRNSQASELLYKDPNPYEVLSRVKKEIITYKRADGVSLSGILYYPLDYEKGKRYPAIVQAYPLEYTDASTAGQVRGSQDHFSVPFREDMIYNALRGYFVLDQAQMPIIGHPETKNDTFIEQLVSSAKAAVDTLDERGLVDRKRIGVVGHSYGAYMVANLLTHSDLFATGIAKSGAYNRTLTPFGFQGERRTFWKAKETYLKMSPFLAADKMKKPILLIHGQADANTGTFTMQSERYFEALKGQGAVAKLVLLPEENHGYAARESIEHVLYEVFTWFDRYLKEPVKEEIRSGAI